MNSDEFWKHRLTGMESKLIMNIIAYCDIYDVLHDEEFNSNDVKAELDELIDNALTMYIKDNYE